MTVGPVPSASRISEGGGILILEDEPLVALDLAQAFEEAGAQVVGPAPNVEVALALIAKAERLDGAVLDINLRGELAFPVADELTWRGVPFLFASATEAGAIPARFAHVTCCEKPVNVSTIVFLLQAQQARQDRSQASRSGQGRSAG